MSDNSYPDTFTEPEDTVELGLAPLLSALRKRGDEVQLTTAIAAIAQTDPQFSSRLVRIVLENAPHTQTASALLQKLPGHLTCRAEGPTAIAPEGRRGRIDLEFKGEGGFHLLIEAKLYSSYYEGQLQRYLDGSSCSGLVGLVRNREENEVEPEDQRWLGSVRWAEVWKDWVELEHAEPIVTLAWRQLLTVAREQGDFGLMDFDTTDIEAWNAYRRGRELLLALLNDISPSIEEHIRSQWKAKYGEMLGLSSSARRISSRQWNTQLMVRFDLPNATGADRFQLSFVGDREELIFTAEGRWGGDTQQLTDEQLAMPGLIRASEYLASRGFSDQGASYGNYWTRPHPASSWLKDDEVATREALISLATADFQDLLQSDLFEALPDDDLP
jgi:hypothetical protein